MSGQNPRQMSYPEGVTQLRPVAQPEKLSYPLETRINAGFSGNDGETGKASVSYPRSSKIPEFVSAKKAMELTGSSWPTIKRHCQKGKFQGA